MEDFLKFKGTVKLLIIERAPINGKNGKFKEQKREIINRLIINDTGQITSELNESNSVEHMYNKKNQLVKSISRNKSGEIIEEISQTYSQSLLIKKEKLFSDQSSRELHQFKYNNLGLLAFELCGLRKHKYQYDQNGNLSKTFKYYDDEPEYAVLYKSDKDGKPLEVCTVDNKGKQLRLERFSWENDLVKTQFIMNQNKVVLKDIYYEYSCFHDGNWLKRVEYSLKSPQKRDPVEVIYRSITYSDNYPEIKPIKIENQKIVKEEKKALSFSDGSEYRGDLLNGKMEGLGFIQWTDGSSYKGEFKNNLMDGKGILTWPNGDIYSGLFEKGKMEGIGRLRWSVGKTFYGIFENNKRTNQGIIEED